MPAPHLVDSLYAWLMAAMCFWIQIWVANHLPQRWRPPGWPGVRLPHLSRAGCVALRDLQHHQPGARFLGWHSVPTLYFLALSSVPGRVSWIPTSVVVLNRYFDVYRASASGLSFAGGALSSILLPPLIGMLMDTYGLQGTMLIVGALMLNTMAGSIELRSSPSFPRPLVLPVISSTVHEM
ncbi:hypothetical protein MRX96_020779 [Rhipicephalus microplus]